MTVSSLPEPNHVNRVLETTSTSSLTTALHSPSVTVEMALYAGVLGLALFLRLFRLGLAPLSDGEAAQALAALRGGVVPIGGSPALYGINSFLMALLSPGDAIVRFAPALIGSLVVVLPAFFRDTLGRFGALGSSLILAISPLALAASRSLSGEVIVIACVLLPIALAQRYEATGNRRALIGAAIALGVGLASGTGIYTALVAFGVSATVLWIVGRRHLEMPPTERPPTHMPPTLMPHIIWRAMTGPANRAAVAAAVVGAFVIAATGGLARPAGLGAAGDLLTAWLSAFGAAGGSSPFDIVQVLLVYETLVLVAGVIGLARALSRADPFGAWLGFAVIVSMATAMLRPGRQPLDLLLPVTLLALLAGYAIQPWAEAVRARASLSVDGIVLAVGFVVTTFLMLTLTAFVRNRIAPTTVLGVVVPSQLAIMATSLVIIGVVAGLLAMMVDARSVLRGAATLALLLLALASLGAGWGATQVRVGDPHEIVWGPNVTTRGVRLLMDTAYQIAIRSQGHVGTQPIRVEVDDPVVAWYLRDARVLPGEAPAGIVTRFGDQPRTTDGGYIGARFNVRESWGTLGLDLRAWLEWALFRTSPGAPAQVTQAVTLWEKR